ncbi:Importin-13 [Halotydeus destructor]|nr:Importin-13 [Halotydeus destructor]
MDFTVAEIERLIYELYHNPSSQALANKYLTLAQCSPNSWTFAWTLLDHSKPVEVQYFGASSLHLKISRNWHELPNDEYKLDLRNRLMECLLRTVQGQNSSRIVQTRLCVALAAYVVQTVSNFWPSAIQDLVSNFSPEKNSSITIPPLRSVLMLVETLMMIPEEFHVIFMSQQEKSLCRNALAKGVNDVFQFIDSVMRTDKQTITLEIKQAAIKCFANWSQHLGPLILGDGHERILDLILYNVNDDDLSAYSVDAISSIYSHPEIHKYPNTVLKLISKLNYLTPVLEAAINDQDGDKCLVLYSLFIQIGETHSRLLLDTVYDKPEYREPISQMITVILKCSATPGYYPIDETCSETAFNFWYTFQDDIIASGQDRIFFYLEMFKPLYEALIDALLRKVQFPPDDIYDQEWNSEDKEAFRCYRQDIGDTFMYCYNMLRTTYVVLPCYSFWTWTERTPSA